MLEYPFFLNLFHQLKRNVVQSNVIVQNLVTGLRSRRNSPDNYDETE